MSYPGCVKVGQLAWQCKGVKYHVLELKLHSCFQIIAYWQATHLRDEFSQAGYQIDDGFVNQLYMWSSMTIIKIEVISSTKCIFEGKNEITMASELSRGINLASD